MTSRLLSIVANSWPASIWQDVPVIVGVSGGADSMALLRALAQTREGHFRGTLVVAHFDHRLRPESGEDAVFVEEWARSWGWEFIGEQAPHGGQASEAAARQLRYEFFRRASAKVGARYLALAHTKNDNVETILHRILRGTGLRGLGGIPFTRRLTEMTTIVRPMLQASRQDVLDFLQSLGQSFCTDPTNESLTFTRNRIRHELLPHLEEHYNPNVGDVLLRLAEHAADSQRVLECSGAKLLEEASAGNVNSEVVFDCEPVMAAGRVLATEMFRHLWREQGWNEQAMTTDSWRRLYHACWEAAPPDFELPGGIRAQRERRWLRLSSPAESQPDA